jgi:cytochrome c
MDSFEWNKIFGAVLGTALVIATLHVFVGGLMEAEKADKPGMEVAVTEDQGGTGSTAPVEEVKADWGTVIPAADIAAGEKTHQRCQQCHDFAKGGPDKIGPNLYGVVGSKHGHAPAYAYSPAIKALADKTWGFDELDAFIKNPKVAVPGTKMSFAGLSKQSDRINLIAYLRTVSDSPLAVPAPNPVAPSTPAESTIEPPAGELQAPPPGTTPPEGATPAPGTPPAGPTTPATPAPTTPAPGGGGH